MAESDIRHWHTKAVGVTQGNRQEIVRRCRPGEWLALAPEPDNPHDPNAVLIRSGQGSTIGYLPRETAASVVANAAKGVRHSAFAAEVTGGDRGKNYGLNILIVESRGFVSTSQIQEYADEILVGDTLAVSRRPSTALHHRPKRGKGLGCVGWSIVIILGLIVIKYISTFTLRPESPPPTSRPVPARVRPTPIVAPPEAPPPLPVRRATDRRYRPGPGPRNRDRRAGGDPRRAWTPRAATDDRAQQGPQVEDDPRH